MEILKISNLTFAYGKECIIKNINISFLKGDYVAIVGSNGTGKSTLFKLIVKDLTSYTGNILWFNQDIKNFSKWNLIGYVPQLNILSGNSFPATVEEIVMASLYSSIGLFRFPKKAHKEICLKSLKKVGIDFLSKKLIGDLSGGQQQKVMLARALVNSPEILLLDEPTVGIDLKSSTEIYELLAQLNKEDNITIITITHDLDRMLKDFNRVLLIENTEVNELSLEEKTNLHLQYSINRRR